MQPNSLLPRKFFTPSACICQHHPNSSVFSGVDGVEQDREKYRTQLRLFRQEFKTLQQKADDWFEQQGLSWGEVFIDLDLTREFATTYLTI